MVRVEGEKISLADLEQIVAGNADEVGLQYDPAEDAYVFVDASTDEQILIARRNGDVVIPVKADIESVDITALEADLDVNNFDLNNIATISGDTVDFSTLVADVLNLTDADIDKLVSNFSANGYDINAIGTASASTVSTSGIDGGVADGQGEITRLPGAGLSVENGDLVVTASFDGISGVSNPLTADLNADGFDVQNVNRLTTEELTDDDPIDLVGTDFVNAGHDDVDVPLVQNLTVADFEGGSLDSFTGSSSYSINSSTVKQGDYSLKVNLDGTELLYPKNEFETYPQAGDSFAFSCYFTSDNTQAKFEVARQENSGAPNTSGSYSFEVKTNDDSIVLYSRFDQQTEKNTSAPVSSHLNEWLELRVDWSLDGSFYVELFDSANNSLASFETKPDTIVKTGYFNFNSNYIGSSGPVDLFYDDVTLTRRTNEYVTNTQKGTTELGNDVQPSGEISTGPLAAPDDALRAKYAEAPVTTDSTQGAESILTLLESADNPSVILRRILDGSGGSYANQLDGALGRFARLNANLSWEYESLADTPSITTIVDNGQGSSATLTGLPRRAEVTNDGTTDFHTGTLRSNVLVNEDSLGPFRITFHDVSYSDVNSDNTFTLGLRDSNSDNQIKYFKTSGGNDRLSKSEAGADDFNFISAVDWSQNHDMTIAVNGSRAELYIDGTLEQGIGFSVDAQMFAFFNVVSAGNNTDTETVSVQQITVEPLGGVLNE